MRHVSGMRWPRNILNHRNRFLGPRSLGSYPSLSACPHCIAVSNKCSSPSAQIVKELKGDDHEGLQEPTHVAELLIKPTHNIPIRQPNLPPPLGPFTRMEF